MNEAEACNAFADIVTPYAKRRYAEVESANLKLAHYTTADSAALILKNQTLWLRNAAVMNDFSEIGHGSRCLELALAAGLGLRLESALDDVHPVCGRRSLSA